MAGAFDKNIDTRPGLAWVWNAAVGKWEKPSKPTGNKVYTWDDEKGWVEDTSVKSTGTGLAGAVGFALTKTLLEDAKYGKGAGGLQEVYDAWLAGDETKALDLYYKSTWFKTLGKTGADRYAMKLNQPGVYASELDAYKIAQKQRLSRVGVKIDDTELDNYLTGAYDGALSDGQLDALIVKSASFGTKFGGDTLTKIQGFKQYAESFGMSYDDKKYSQWGSDLFAGNITDSEIQQNIRTESASAYPAFADRIMKGVTLDALASAYKSSMASILEIDPDSISYTDPTLRKALQGMAQGKGADYSAAMPLWEFEKQLKMDARWQYTNNARDTIDSLSLKVFKDWGMA
jgi:hypothetical protein